MFWSVNFYISKNRIREAKRITGLIRNMIIIISNKIHKKKIILLHVKKHLILNISNNLFLMILMILTISIILTT
jgi:hypothetical protein